MKMFTKSKAYPNKMFFFGIAIFSLMFCQSSTVDEQTPPDPPTGGGNTGSYATASFWLTKADESSKLQKQTDILFNNAANNYQTLDVDASQKYQTIDGFGYTLTGGSVQVINQLSAAKKEDLLQDLFSNKDNSIAVSYIRLSIGASDLNSSVFSYDDMPAGQTDLSLANFSLAKDQALIDMLKKILTINPNIKIMATPWSPPVWMKDNGSTIGGSLQPQYYNVYAQYFVKYIQGMKAQGITIDAITPQNEPLHPGNNPSLLMTATQQAAFIKNSLGPAFQDTDYTGDGNDSTWLRGINTWAGSGTSPFNGKISSVGSTNSNNPTGTFTATQTGVAYFAIRSGGNDMKEGISITNIEFRGVN